MKLKFEQKVFKCGNLVQVNQYEFMEGSISTERIRDPNTLLFKTIKKKFVQTSETHGVWCEVE